MILIPVPIWLIFYIIAACILGIIPALLAGWLVEGGIDVLMGKVIFVIGMAIEVFLILFLFGKKRRK